MNKVFIPAGDTPLWQLTVDQFRSLLHEFQQPPSVVADIPDQQEKRWVRGIAGIKNLFGVSYTTAHRLKETIIKPAVQQQGRVIMVDAELARKLFKEHEQVKSLRKSDHNKNI